MDAQQLIGGGMNGPDESGILGMWPWLSSCSLGAQQTMSLNFSAWALRQDQEKKTALIICSALKTRRHWTCFRKFGGQTVSLKHVPLFVSVTFIFLYHLHFCVSLLPNFKLRFLMILFLNNEHLNFFFEYVQTSGANIPITARLWNEML